MPANTLITPPIGKDGKRIRYTILEYETLIDSVNINFADWIKLASDIEANYEKYDGFVILHGTDSMAYTSSALSFLLEGLNKTVIVTGAQVPLGQLRNDAVDNVLGSLVLAGCYTVPEVCLYFDHKLFRGNRTRKVSTTDFEAFLSPNLVPLAKRESLRLVSLGEKLTKSGSRGEHRAQPRKHFGTIIKRCIQGSQEYVNICA